VKKTKGLLCGGRRKRTTKHKEGGIKKISNHLERMLSKKRRKTSSERER